MSGRMVSRALQARFETIRQSELTRLDKKLRGLSETDRLSIEALTAAVIHAIARVPEHAIDEATQPQALEALVRLFELGGEVTASQ